MRVRAAAIAAAVAIGAIGWLAVGKQLRTGNDFPIYWTACRDLLAGRSPYDVASGLHGYVYLPFWALLLAPIAWLPLPAAAGIWYLVNIAAFALSLRWLLAIGRRAPEGSRAGLALIAALVPLLGIVHDNLVLGQANLVWTALIVAAVAGAIAPATGLRHGFPLGVAAALKMPAALALLPLALRGRWRPVAGFAVAIAFAFLLPVAMLGPARTVSLHREWVAKVVTPAREGRLQGSKVWDQSPQAALRRLLVDEPAFGETRVAIAALSREQFARVSRAVSVAVVAFYAAFWLLAPRKAGPRALLLDLALACCAMLQVAGFNLKAQFVLLLVPLFAAALHASRPGERESRAVLALVAIGFLVSYRDLVGRNASDWLLAYSSITWSVALLAVLLARLRLGIETPASERS